MYFSLVFPVVFSAGIAVAEVFEYPLPNGFPSNVSKSTLQDIAYQAGGSYPPSSGAMNLTGPAAQALQGLAFNEIFEVAFFTQLLQNVTLERPGYKLGNNSAKIIAALNSSQAQEEIHFLNANDALKDSSVGQVQPCKYDFPVRTFKEAMSMADDFSGLLIGAVPSVITDFGTAPPIVYQFSSILGQEGQQDGYFRWLQSEVPNESPFLTSTTLSFVYNHIMQNYIVPGSCPQKYDLPTYGRLQALGSPPPENSTLLFSTDQPNVTDKHHYIAYMSGQIPPYAVPISNISQHGNTTTFTADFPYDVGFSRGLTIAALVNQNLKFENVSQVANVTLAGPGLIQVNYN